jgi:hypothetical protein
MRCVNFQVCRKRTGGYQKKICWKRWRMCGECAVIYHPEAYSESYVRKTRTRIRTLGVRNIKEQSELVKN